MAKILICWVALKDPNRISFKVIVMWLDREFVSYVQLLMKILFLDGIWRHTFNF